MEEISAKKHNDDAERAVLGVALSGGDVNEILRKTRREDFVTPAHQLIYDAIKALNEESVNIEVLSVLTEMKKNDSFKKLPHGGASYLTELYSASPALSSLSYYIRLLKDATAYRNIEFLGELAQQMTSPQENLSPSEVIANISNKIESLAEENISNEVSSITDVLSGTLDEVMAIQKGEGVSGMPTGFKDLDEHLNGLQPGQMVIIAARPGMGKALALDTPIPTPKGITTMRELRKGSIVYDSNREPAKVIDATDVMKGRPCYKITFSTGEDIIADAEHQWFVTFSLTHPSESKSSVSTRTPQIFKSKALGPNWGVLKTTEQLYWESVNNPNAVCSITAPGKKVNDFKKRKVEIISIEKVETVPVKCVQVDSDDHLFLIGHSEVPTHNSSLALDIARNVSVRQDKSVIIFSLEMGAPELGMRALGAEGYVDLKLMRVENGMDDHKWAQLQAAAERLHGKKLAIDDNPNVTMEDIKAKAKLWKQKNGLDLIVVDYIQLMNSSRRFDSRQQEVSEISRAIKLLAKDLEIPVIALSQLNRGPEQRADKKPSLADLRESGSIEQDADIVMLIHREEVYDKESPRAGEADVIVAKNRSGPIGSVILSWLGKFSRFDNRTL